MAADAAERTPPPCRCASWSPSPCRGGMVRCSTLIFSAYRSAHPAATCSVLCPSGGCSPPSNMAASCLRAILRRFAECGVHGSFACFASSTQHINSLRPSGVSFCHSVEATQGPPSIAHCADRSPLHAPCREEIPRSYPQIITPEVACKLIEPPFGYRRHACPPSASGNNAGYAGSSASRPIFRSNGSGGGHRPGSKLRTRGRCICSSIGP